jgi:hypothetical protein
MTASEPIKPPAPPRFSMITGVFRISLTLGATWRMTISVDAPGANGTTILIGCSGHSARADAAASKASVTSHLKNFIRGSSLSSRPLRLQRGAGSSSTVRRHRMFV